MVHKLLWEIKRLKAINYWCENESCQIEEAVNILIYSDGSPIFLRYETAKVLVRLSKSLIVIFKRTIFTQKILKNVDKLFYVLTNVAIFLDWFSYSLSKNSIVFWIGTLHVIFYFNATYER